jgi:prevent-host-death family protein
MLSVGVRELRQNLSVYLRRVEAGEALRVTDHGRPVALLTPLPPDDDPFADLIASGRATAPRRPFSGARHLPLPDDGRPALSEVLQQMRDEDDR